MATVDHYLHLLPQLENIPGKNVWISYDQQADVLYINFGKPGQATDSELTDDDVIVRYDGDQVIGYTVLHASKRAV